MNMVIEPGVKVRKIGANHRSTSAWGDILNLALYQEDNVQICRALNGGAEPNQHQVLAPDEEIVGIYGNGCYGNYPNNIPAFGFIVKTPLR